MFVLVLYALSVSSLVSKVFAPDGGIFPLEGFSTGFFSPRVRCRLTCSEYS